MIKHSLNFTFSLKGNPYTFIVEAPGQYLQRPWVLQTFSNFSPLVHRLALSFRRRSQKFIYNLWTKKPLSAVIQFCLTSREREKNFFDQRQKQKLVTLLSIKGLVDICSDGEFSLKLFILDPDHLRLFKQKHSELICTNTMIKSYETLMKM